MTDCPHFEVKNSWNGGHHIGGKQPAWRPGRESPAPRATLGIRCGEKMPRNIPHGVKELWKNIKFVCCHSSKLLAGSCSSAKNSSLKFPITHLYSGELPNCYTCSKREK